MDAHARAAKAQLLRAHSLPGTIAAESEVDDEGAWQAFGKHMSFHSNPSKTYEQWGHPVTSTTCNLLTCVSGFESVGALHSSSVAVCRGSAEAA